ncbi:MAG: selenocysteine-specific translation elongation factor [Syntrophomonadaceae bacterium]|nr:selenocysteine-specific translation elongation factor [Syntrophomonadaceae bacterium]
MKRLIIGTAGHIDHGKTTLVKALTGIETDRLKEEKQRGISIELGFAPFVLPNGQKAAIVDMPGHERFIRHMLAGAFGIDIVILTIAADEGIMPQTREHMDIIELLGVKKGVVALTKKDLVDEEWLMLVEDEVQQYLKGSLLNDAPIIPLSAATGEGLPQLLEVLEKLAGEVQEKPAFGHARLPIDRVFTISGFGTVVTGTLWSGQINVGETLELMPEQKQVKVRNLQVHGDKVNTAYAGQRVAVNLQGVDVAEINRGNLLATSGFLQPSYRVDCRLRLLKSSVRQIKNWSRIRFHLGTEEAMGRVALLDRDELLPGEETYAQIVLEKPIVCYKGDPFVIRYYSPVTTIGGGTIIDANAPRQKRFREDILEQLATKEEGSLYDIILQEIEARPQQVVNLNGLVKATGATGEQVGNELDQLLEDEKIQKLQTGEYISANGLNAIYQNLEDTLKTYHERYPLRSGYSKEDLRSRLFPHMNGKVFNAVLGILENKGQLVNRNNLVALATHETSPGEKEQQIIARIMEEITGNLFTPPGVEEIRDRTGADETLFTEILSYLLTTGKIVKLSGDIYFAAQAIENGKSLLAEYFSREKELSLATARDLFNTSRKYAVPLIEYYDKTRFTRRVGDIRIKTD